MKHSPCPPSKGDLIRGWVGSRRLRVQPPSPTDAFHQQRLKSPFQGGGREADGGCSPRLYVKTSTGIRSQARHTRLLCAILLLHLLLTPVNAAATAYYVDAADGNDTAPGTAESAPWKSLAKVNAVGRATGYQPGDAILLKRGGMWRETLVLFDYTAGKYSAGTAAAPIRIGVYGTGERPIINGADRVEGWTPHSGQIWKAPLPWTPTQFAPVPDVVYFDGKRGTRRPSIPELVQPRDWCWQDVSLYVCAESDPGALYAATGVEAAARDHAIWGTYNANADHILIEDIELRNANHKNLSVEIANDHWTLRRVLAHHNGRIDGNDKNGLYFAGGIGHTLTECVVYESGANNINFLQCADVIVERCASYDCHHHCIDIKGGVTGGRADNNVIRYNTAYLNAGFETALVVNGIFAGLGNNPGLSKTRIHHNIVLNLNGRGIQIDADASEILVANNLVMNCRQADYYISTLYPTVLRNNIGISTSGPVIGIIRGLSQKIIDYNCWAGSGILAQISPDALNYQGYGDWPSYKAATGFDVHSLHLPPAFINPDASDYRLPPGSPCIDAGADTGIATDIVGTAIPQGAKADIGPFEIPPQPADVNAPAITLRGDPIIKIMRGSPYNDPGATAADDRDGDITSRIVTTANVDTGAVGEYRITYNVADAAGNPAPEVLRIVRVLDKPIITLKQ